MLFELFDRIEQSYLGVVIRDSSWLFPAIESLHLIGLAILAGAILIVDLRMLNVVFVNYPLTIIDNSSRRWLSIGMSIMVTTGIPLFVSEAIKCYYNPFFWIKMATLVTIIIFTLTIKKHIIHGSKYQTNLIAMKATGIFSMAGWLLVTFSGRWIGFY